MRGSCPDGDKCKLYHRKRKIKRRRSSSLSGTKTPRPFAKKVKLRRSSDEISNLRSRFYISFVSILLCVRDMLFSMDTLV